MRNLPKSADLISVNNDEYFITRANYVNQKAACQDGGNLEDNQQQLKLSSSNSNIPQSLV